MRWGAKLACSFCAEPGVSKSCRLPPMVMRTRNSNIHQVRAKTFLRTQTTTGGFSRGATSVKSARRQLHVQEKVYRGIEDLKHEMVRLAG